MPKPEPPSASSIDPMLLRRRCRVHLVASTTPQLSRNREQPIRFFPLRLDFWRALSTLAPQSPTAPHRPRTRALERHCSNSPRLRDRVFPAVRLPESSDLNSLCRRFETGACLPCL